MFRDDETARDAYVAALERKARRVDVLEARIRELEAEIHALRSAPPPAPGGGVELLADELGPTEAVHLDAAIEKYIALLIRATSPQRTGGILSGAPASTAALMQLATQASARAAGRRYAFPSDVQHAAREVLPARIVMRDPGGDARTIVRAILDVVDVP